MIASFPKTEKHFAKFSNIIVLILLFAAATILHATGAVVTADGFQLKLNGQPFAIKGMNYSPVPIGAAPRYSPMAIISFRITPMSGSRMWTICAQPESM